METFYALCGFYPLPRPVPVPAVEASYKQKTPGLASHFVPSHDESTQAIHKGSVTLLHLP